MASKAKRCRDCGAVGGHNRDCPRAIAKMGGGDTGVLPNGRQCPKCKRLLASGAWCPVDGNPIPQGELDLEPRPSFALEGGE